MFQRGIYQKESDDSEYFVTEGRKGGFVEICSSNNCRMMRGCICYFKMKIRSFINVKFNSYFFLRV